ncbi:hypothetical protein M8J77_026106 [Diaphorina citri]|nr:hypothetical protein M8J77_009933 [Diaphorina citri]KAI5725106.1 hypothetical protein M8J77_011104 [Diaphorina citri]KAI5756589.1 hypothetical protein M8J77_026106 [Diaphorina citri]
MNVENLMSEAMGSQWSHVTELNDTNAKVELFTDMVTRLLNKHAPLKNAKVKYPPTPWLNPEILKLMQRRDRAYNKYRRTKSEQDLVKYKLLRNRCNRSVRDTKELYISRGIASCKNEKSLWQFLRSLGVNVDDSAKRFDPKFSLNDLNKHFVTPPVNLDPTHKQKVIDRILAHPDPPHPEFSFQEVSCVDVHDLQLYLPSSVDNISQAIHMMNQDLQQLHQWTVIHGILPNPKKFQCIIIGSIPLIDSQHSHHTRSQHLLDIPLHRTDFMGKSFTVNAARLWNQLPTELRVLQSRLPFKLLAKEYMLALDN